MLESFKAGQRVTATLFGEVRTGTVTCQRSPSLVWVRWDDTQAVRWVHVTSLTLI